MKCSDENYVAINERLVVDSSRDRIYKSTPGRISFEHFKTCDCSYPPFNNERCGNDRVESAYFGWWGSLSTKVLFQELSFLKWEIKSEKNIKCCLWSMNAKLSTCFSGHLVTILCDLKQKQTFPQVAIRNLLNLLLKVWQANIWLILQAYTTRFRYLSIRKAFLKAGITWER